jgi:hypothetical protein
MDSSADQQTTWNLSQLNNNTNFFRKSMHGTGTLLAIVLHRLQQKIKQINISSEFALASIILITVTRKILAACYFCRFIVIFAVS